MLQLRESDSLQSPKTCVVGGQLKRSILEINHACSITFLLMKMSCRFAEKDTLGANKALRAVEESKAFAYHEDQPHAYESIERTTTRSFLALLTINSVSSPKEFPLTQKNSRFYG